VSIIDTTPFLSFKHIFFQKGSNPHFGFEGRNVKRKIVTLFFLKNKQIEQKYNLPLTTMNDGNTDKNNEENLYFFSKCTQRDIFFCQNGRIFAYFEKKNHFEKN